MGQEMPGLEEKQMDQKFTAWLVKEPEKNKFAPIDYLLIVGMFVAGVMLRGKVWNAPFEESPYQNLNIYMKGVSVLFDIMVAVFLGILVYHFKKDKIQAILAYGIGMVFPVLVAGSAMWAMCDSIYVFLVLLSLYLLLADDNNLTLAVVIYGLAVFLNLYALFLLPVYIWCFFAKEGTGNSILAYFSPVAGGVLHMLLDNGASSAFILFREEGKFLEARGVPLLSYNAPNLFRLIGADAYIVEYGKGFLYVTIGFVTVATVIGIGYMNKLTSEKIVYLAMLLCMIIPWIMPGMNERAGLLASILSLVYGFIHINHFYVPVIQTTITYMSYAAYFRGESYVELKWVAFAQLGLILYLIWDRMKIKKN